MAEEIVIVCFQRAQFTGALYKQRNRLVLFWEMSEWKQLRRFQWIGRQCHDSTTILVEIRFTYKGERSMF